jgi:hypothetical protein
MPVLDATVGVGAGLCVAVRLGRAVRGSPIESIRIADESPPDQRCATSFESIDVRWIENDAERMPLSDCHQKLAKCIGSSANEPAPV